MKGPDFTYEQELIDNGYIPCGIDETSRGSLISSVFAGAVILNTNFIAIFKDYINDSKKLSKKKCEELADFIKVTCTWAIGEASHQEIEKLNILNATVLAMRRAVANIPTTTYIIADGNMVFKGGFAGKEYKSIVKGDSKCLSIAAGSIIAKDHQRKHMLELDKLYPEYDLKNCNGYGTKNHMSAIKKYGPCPLHRKTFKGVKEYV